jgi:uncharacterized protein YyaL (SSP411 family)
MLDKSDNHSNRLIGSLSPYLQQHAYNPVDWYEWGEEAFEKARNENKLMLVSIGYSACHWCHVMAHESFEDPETAALMNQHFVCIKIDREELPDIDQLYMDACQLVNGSGGWPLNAFTLPDKRPIHALTYLPKNQWQKLLGSIQGLWQDNPAAAEAYAVKLSKGIAGISLPPELQVNTGEKPIGEEILQVFINQYDDVYGGPNRAPKFPMPNNYRYLLQYGEISGNKQATEMGLFTLKHMALGGIYDIVGGGFSRYSVDARWFAPHFEKMLYDNAQLISLYSYGFAISQNPLFRQVALQTLDFCWEELYSHDDLYYSAYDADSEGVEGLYYTYTYAELEQVLGEDTLFFCQYFQCTKAGNWEHGRNILYALDTLPEASVEMDIDLTVFEQTITKCLVKLKTFRDNRIKPGLDDKHICSWNNLMLKALAEAGMWLQDYKWIERADILAAAILQNFYGEQSLKRIAKNGTSKIDAFLEDHATLIDGLISLYQAGFNEMYLLQAKDICSQTIEKFFRTEHGFFEFNSTATFITKKFDISDDVINSGNSMMAHNLWRLSWYFDLPEWREMADRMLQAIVPLLKTSAPWYSHWAAFQLIKEHGTQQIILSADETFKQSLPLSAYYKIPNAIFGFAGKETAIPLFKGKEYKGQNLIYPCLDHVCNTPLNYEPRS